MKRMKKPKAHVWTDRAKDTSEASGDCLALWRPAWETGPALWGLGAAAFAGAAGASGILGHAPALAMAGAGLAIAARRTRDACAVWKQRLPLSGKTPAFMSFDDLALMMRRMGKDALPGAARHGFTPAEAIRGAARQDGVRFLPAAESPVTSLWAGQGFSWTPAEAQRLYELSRADWRAMLVPLPIRRFFSDESGLGDDSPGIPVIHGVGESEEPVVRPLSSLGGGTLLVGTTQAGKGVVLTSLVSQAILRGEAVIVIDPKSSKRLRHAVIAACRAAGRPEPMEFHPAFPKRGVKLNPLGTFTRSTEIASRICAVLPDGDGAFVAFAWRAIYVMTEGLLFLGRQPSLRAFRSLLERGIEPLLEDALRKDLAAKTPLWEERLEIILDQESRSLKIPLGSSADLELAALVLLWERTAGSLAAEPAVEGLISVYRHSREHYAKITASLLPVLSMLTAGPLGESLSPDTPEASAMKALSGEAADERPVVTLEGVIDAGGVLYLGLDALPDAETACALGALLLSDLAGAAGRRYSAERSGNEAVRTNLFVDETANIINQPLIELLNKGMEAGIHCTCAMQTVSDLEARLGSPARARMALGNFNNLIALRTKDEVTQKFVAEAFGRTTVWETSSSVGTAAETEAVPAFRSTASRQLSGSRESVVPLEALGQLPNLEYFVSLSGGKLWKCRMPILDPRREGLCFFAENR